MKNNKFNCNGRHKGGSRGVAVYAHPGESIDSLLSRFKKEVITTGILDEYKERGAFVKPSVKARLKRSTRKSRARKSNLY